MESEKNTRWNAAKDMFTRVLPSVLSTSFVVKPIRVKSGAYLHAIKGSERLKTVHLSIRLRFPLRTIEREEGGEKKGKKRKERKEK